MATDAQIDKAAGDMHLAVMTLYMERLAQPEAADEGVQAAMLTGVIAAASMLLWKGRTGPHMTPNELSKYVKRTALDFLKQYEADDAAKRTAAN